MSLHPDKNYFEIYKGDCDVFIETGTYKLEGVKLALAAGFMEIYTIDIKEHTTEYLQTGMANLVRYYDDSATVFNWFLPKLKGRKPFFWLDAHSQLTEGEEDNFPLLRELEEIKKSGISNATILIDDFLFMSHKEITGWTKKLIERKVREINPSYRIEYLSNPIKNNILMARA